MKTSRIVFSFVILIAAGLAAYFIFPPVRLWALVVAGHSPNCPMSHAVKSKTYMHERIRIKDRILAGSHLVKEDSGLELWRTPKGDYWIPKGNRYVLPFNLAEMEQHIYGTAEHFIHAGDVVLDCGASDGDFTRQALEAGAQTGPVTRTACVWRGRSRAAPACFRRRRHRAPTVATNGVRSDSWRARRAKDGPCFNVRSPRSTPGSIRRSSGQIAS